MKLALLLAAAQLTPLPPPIVPSTPVEQPALQMDLVLKAGSDRVFFSGNDYGLDVAARASLAAQARWLLANPAMSAVIEGHSDQRDSRDHAIAIGERRATAVRDYLVSLGVPTYRLSIASWGKERPMPPGPAGAGVDRNGRVVIVIVR